VHAVRTAAPVARAGVMVAIVAVMSVMVVLMFVMWMVSHKLPLYRKMRRKIHLKIYAMVDKVKLYLIV
jgi:hypothetical protein